MSLLIRGGRILSGASPALTRADVLIDGDRITAVGPALTAPEGAGVIDAGRPHRAPRPRQRSHPCREPPRARPCRELDARGSADPYPGELRVPHAGGRVPVGGHRRHRDAQDRLHRGVRSLHRLARRHRRDVRGGGPRVRRRRGARRPGPGGRRHRLPRDRAGTARPVAAGPATHRGGHRAGSHEGPARPHRAAHQALARHGRGPRAHRRVADHPEPGHRRAARRLRPARARARGRHPHAPRRVQGPGDREPAPPWPVDRRAPRRARRARPGFVGAHGVWLGDDDIRMLADAGAAVAHNPGSNLRLGCGIAPVRELLDRGVAVGLGTDGSVCADNQNLFEALRIASVISTIRFPTRRAAGSTPPPCGQMATAGSARVLGLCRRPGRGRAGQAGGPRPAARGLGLPPAARRSGHCARLRRDRRRRGHRAGRRPRGRGAGPRHHGGRGPDLRPRASGGGPPARAERPGLGARRTARAVRGRGVPGGGRHPARLQPVRGAHPDARRERARQSRRPVRRVRRPREDRPHRSRRAVGAARVDPRRDRPGGAGGGARPGARADIGAATASPSSPPIARSTSRPISASCARAWSRCR